VCWLAGIVSVKTPGTNLAGPVLAPGRGRPRTDDRVRYRKRSSIEQCVGWLKECRAVATRYEKLALNFLGLVKLACIERYLRLLTRAKPQSLA
jgi:transposase